MNMKIYEKAAYDNKRWISKLFCRFHTESGLTSSEIAEEIDKHGKAIAA